MLDSITSNGSLSPQEIIKQALAKIQDSEKLSEELITANDSDNDSLLSMDEVSLSAEAFAKIDSDSDGFLNGEELTVSVDAYMQKAINSFLENPEAAAKAHTGDFNDSDIVSKIIARRDKDGDGYISKDESRFKGKKFEIADSDGDGLLTQDEIAKYLDRMIAEAKQRMGATNINTDDSPQSLLDVLEATEKEKEETNDSSALDVVA